MLSCTIKRNEKPDNPYTIVDQTYIDEDIIFNELKDILSDKDKINNILKTTKTYIEKTHSIDNFKKNIFNNI